MATVGAGTRTYTFNGSSGHPYQIGVAAENKAGIGPSMNTHAELAQAPSPPGGLATRDADPGDRAYNRGQVVLSWTPPSDTGGEGVDIDHYEMAHESGHPASQTEYEFDDLQGGEPLTYRIRAVNSAGIASEWVTFPTVTPTTAPAWPDIFLTTLPGSVGVSWGAVDDGGAPVDEYRYRVNGGEWVTSPGGTAILQRPGGSTSRPRCRRTMSAGGARSAPSRPWYPAA